MLPSIWAEKPLERFIRPVSIANMLDSILEGIILAKSTMPGSLWNASLSKSVTVEVTTMKTRGGIPKYIYLTKRMQPMDPSKLVKHAITIIIHVSLSFRYAL